MPHDETNGASFINFAKIKFYGSFSVNVAYGDAVSDKHGD